MRGSCLVDKVPWIGGAFLLRTLREGKTGFELWALFCGGGWVCAAACAVLGLGYR